MDKARQARAAGPAAEAPGAFDDLLDAELFGGSDPERLDEVLPAYSRTRVQPVDPLSLVRNKVLSVLHSGKVTDQFKILRTQILDRLASLGGNSVLITSAGPGEGKTFTAMNLAVSIAHEISRTAVLIDADIRKPSVHGYFGLGEPLGLSDYLLGKAELPELLINPGIPRLTILPAGNSLGNSSELLGSPRMGALADEMKKRYPERVLVFDSPSLLTSADALTFSRHTDGVLLVVESERTQRKDLARAIELIGGRPILGIVVNKARDGG
jgi:non-specific protein-tyrosine kinase